MLEGNIHMEGGRRPAYWVRYRESCTVKSNSTCIRTHGTLMGVPTSHVEFNKK